MPCLRTSSVTFTPASACFRIAMILSSVNRDFFIRVLSLRKTLLPSGPALQGVTQRRKCVEAMVRAALNGKQGSLESHLRSCSLIDLCVNYCVRNHTWQPIYHWIPA